MKTFSCGSCGGPITGVHTMTISPLWHGCGQPEDWAIAHLCSRRCEDRFVRATHVYSEANDPGTYGQLSVRERQCVETWVRENFVPVSRFSSVGTYQLKHVFEKAQGGFYVTNGQFAAAMLAVGFQCDDRSPGRLNYRFRVKKSSARRLARAS